MQTKNHNGLSVPVVLLCLYQNPHKHLIRRWNWKAACLSSIFRGIVVLAVNIPSGGVGAAGAMFAEVCYRGLTAGFFSAGIQAFRYVRPVWAASIVTMVLIPGIADSMELLLHFMRGTPRLGTTIAASIIVTSISTLFELFLMRHGVLVMGKTGGSLTQDIKRLPLLIADFFEAVWGRMGAIFNMQKRGKLSPVAAKSGSCVGTKPNPPLQRLLPS